MQLELAQVSAKLEQIDENTIIVNNIVLSQLKAILDPSGSVNSSGQS
jgi:hypothetical protein